MCPLIEVFITHICDKKTSALASNTGALSPFEPLRAGYSGCRPLVSARRVPRGLSLSGGNLRYHIEIGASLCDPVDRLFGPAFSCSTLHLPFETKNMQMSGYPHCSSQQKSYPHLGAAVTSKKLTGSSRLNLGLTEAAHPCPRKFGMMLPPAQGLTLHK